MKTSRVQAFKIPVIALIFLCFFLPEFLSAQAQRITLADMQVGAAPVWSQDIGGRAMGKILTQAESVLLSSGGNLRSFYMTGTPVWNFSPPVEISPHLARSMEGAAFISDATGYFRAVNRIGRELWRVDLGRPISHSPVVGWDGRVFIPFGSMLSCRTASGLPLWTIDLESPMAIAPALDRAGSVVTVLENMDFVRISPFSRVERIRLSQMPALIVSLRTGTGHSFVLFYPNGQGERLDYNESSARGSRLSRTSFPALPAPPAAAAAAVLAVERDGYFAVTLRNGRVQLMDETGQVIWTGETHESPSERGSGSLALGQATMLFDDRGIYSVSTRGATSFALDGRRRFIHRFPEASTIPALSDEGVLYVSAMDGRLNAYMLDSRQRTVVRSRFYGPEPEGNYGMGNPPRSPWFEDRNRFEAHMQDAMIARIDAAIDSGQIAEMEPIYVAYLMEMIGFFLFDPHYSRVRPSVNPVRHVEYIRLLGRVGSRETIPFLWNVFDRYPEPAVKAACAEAIGDIGVDPHGNTFMSYRFLIAANNPNRDPQLLMSAAISIAALSRFSGPPLSADGIVLMRHLSNLTWAPIAVRNFIRQELDALYREGLDTVIR